MTLVVVLASALCLFFCMAGQTVWPLAWTAPFPVLALAPSLRSLSSATGQRSR